MGRVCSNCGSTKTSTYQPGIVNSSRGWSSPRKSPGERWYRDGNNGWWCTRCNGRIRYRQNRASIEVPKPYNKKLKLLRSNPRETLQSTISRVIDYYIENRLDKQTRKELLSQL